MSIFGAAGRIARSPLFRVILVIAASYPLPAQTQGPKTMNHPTAYRVIQVDGLSIFYREAGPRDAPTILLLHGLPSSSRMFEPLFARLSDGFERCILGLSLVREELRRRKALPAPEVN